MTDRMKTIVINGTPYRMRGDMHLPNYRKDISKHDPFKDGHARYLTTPASCEQKARLVAEGKSK